MSIALDDRSKRLWTLTEKDDGCGGAISYWICPHCGKEPPVHPLNHALKYCPNCGAEMRDA